jgi:HPt (histidine-containing phosphotransfer) domain-containing protein
MAVDCDFGLLEQAAPAPDGVLELVAVLVDDLRANRRAVQDALSSGDFDTAARLAHSIGGAASVVAARLVSGAAVQLEQSIRAHHWPEIAVRLDQLDSHLDALVGTLQSWMAETVANAGHVKAGP